MRVNAYAAPAAGKPLAPTVIERREVGPNDVLIQIEYAGICHSDIHTVNGDWGPQPFPVVPGHEIVGVVTEAGSDVSRHRVGDRVGVGCMVNSCGECTNCRNGDEQYCLEGMVGTITKHLKKGARIRMSGLGILQVRKRPARMGRNPATGEAIKIKASKKIAFRAAKDLKEAI